jgi:hypothetical protein
VVALLAQVFLIHEPIVALQDRSLLTGLEAVLTLQQLFNTWLLPAEAAEVKRKMTLEAAVAAVADSAQMSLGRFLVIIVQPKPHLLLRLEFHTQLPLVMVWV